MTSEEPLHPHGSDEATRCVLFDFDGPLVHLFAGYSTARVAREVRRELRRRWGIRYQPLRRRGNCHGVITAFPKLTRDREHERQAIEEHVLAMLTAAERRAVSHAAPTAGAEELVIALHAGGWKLAITSNNATEAIHDYLDQARSTRIRPLFAGAIVGRGRIADMKPEPVCVHDAMYLLGMKPEGRAVLLGDSVSDYQAAVAAKIDFVGYSRRRRKRRQLRRAGASPVFGNLSDVRAALDS